MPAITVIALIDQINVLNSDTSPHMISHSYVHPCTYESTHAYTSVASVDPLWGQEHQWPLRFFCPMVSCWADISVCSDDSLTWCLFGLATCFHLNRYAARRKRRGWRRRRRAEPSGALTWRTRADNGRPVEAEREEVHHPHYGCLCFKSCTRRQLLTGIYVRNEKPPQQHKQLLSCLFAFGVNGFLWITYPPALPREG